MLLELATSTQPKLFRNTVVAFRLDGGPIQVFSSKENEEPTLVCLLQTLLQKCQQYESVEVRSPRNTLTRPFEERWYDNWVATDFAGKKKYSSEWKALKKLFDEKGIERPAFTRNDKDGLTALKNEIQEKRTGRKKQAPYVPPPGEPDENPWSKDEETLEEYLARKDKE
ncbi:hypothetical protein ASC80_12935 [Afipia sp. Root123D2]|uniref:hypothetical protein n=1 Tax=Afipia sp. Root123D2 TaxID=1736436 RepID=UPI0006FBE621|nr:hypothetical protein [Afipia sp. Root123D2]KQW21046.1 hypothetical protein ASC80_12935 [Afipia sp. Root123D2]